MFRNIIWDADGTLFDTYPALTQAFQVALRDLGVASFDVPIESLARVSLNHCVQTLAKAFSLDSHSLLQAFQTHYAKRETQEQPLFPGAIDVCQIILARGGKNVIVTHRDGTSLNQLLVEHHIVDLFADRLTGDDGFPKKPDPTSFFAMMEKHGFMRHETLAVGDRQLDIQAARSAGLYSCLFAPQNQIIPGADLVITNFAALVRFLKTR